MAAGIDKEPVSVEEAPRTWQLPSAFTVLAGVTLVVWVLAFIVPTGAYDVSEDTGAPVPGRASPPERSRRRRFVFRSAS